MRSELVASPNGGDTLSDVLLRAQIALPVGLQWAASIGVKLQEMHRRDRRHGKVTPQNVRVADAGPELVQPSQDFWSACTPDRDVRGFGAMLYEIVTGTQAPEPGAAPVAAPALPSGDEMEMVRTAAIRLALKCLGQLPAKPNMRQATMEVRLLWMKSRRLAARERKGAASGTSLLVSDVA